MIGAIPEFDFSSNTDFLHKIIIYYLSVYGDDNFKRIMEIMLLGKFNLTIFSG